jgi:DNA-directed RNA polymerase subunit alpha
VELNFKYTKSSIEESGNIVGHFTISNLEKGQGLTIGNALRRVLLSNIEGTAITGIKIPNVSHEFSIINGVREDILEIILNIKQIVLKTSEKSPIFGKIRLQGPGVITAKCFEFNSKVFIINPNQYIATIATNTLVEFECIGERGIGYKFENENEPKSSDFINVDAIFMPVIKVNYELNNTYISYNQTVESLNLEIITNGSITPEKALSDACEKLINWFTILRNEKILKLDPVIKKEVILKPKLILIEELQLPVRAYNCLKRSGINSVDELIKYSQEEIKNIKNFGKKSANQVFQALKTKFNIILPSLKS